MLLCHIVTLLLRLPDLGAAATNITATAARERGIVSERDKCHCRPHLRPTILNADVRIATGAHRATKGVALSRRRMAHGWIELAQCREPRARAGSGDD